MQASPTLSRAPDFAHRLATILAALAALVARRFLRDPFHAPLIVPLWTRLTRVARRLDRAFARLAAGLSPRPRAANPRASGPRRVSVLPTRRGWLVAALGSEAAAYATQIESLLAEPAAADALANSPAARRTLAPIRRMLGLAPPRPLPAPLPLREGMGEGFVRPIRAWPAKRTKPGEGVALPPPARPWWLPPRRLRSG